MAGPIVKGHNLSINIYKGDGSLLLGNVAIDENGRFKADVGGYIGVIVAKVVDAASNPDYLDEGTGAAKDLNAQLIAVGEIIAGSSVLTLNINPVTTIAALRAGLAADGSGSVSASAVTTSNLETGAALGLSDITSGQAILTINADGSSNLANANAYGKVLAALSGADKANGGNTQASIEAVAAGITGSGASATLNAAAQAVVIVGGFSAGIDSIAITAVIKPDAANAATALGADLSVLNCIEI